MQLNPHYAELNESYLFSTIAHKVADYQKAHPEADVIRLGIGDVTLPLAASVTEAMHKAVEEQGHKGTFHGYIPSEQGYEFLRDAIRRYYAGHGVELDMSEISSPTVPRATWATCWTCSVRTTRSLFPTRSTRSTSMTT